MVKQMKKVIVMLLWVAVMGNLVACSAENTASSEEISTKYTGYWKDESLEKSLRNYTKIKGDITLEDVQDMTDLSVSGATDLSALGELTNLTFLEIEGGYVSDLSFLSSLSNLQRLVIEGDANLTDLSGISNLPNLTELSIYDCVNLTDLSGISNLPNLTTLYIRGCSGLKGLNGENNLPKLTELTLYECMESSFGFLGSLSNLQKLTIRGCDLSDFDLEFTPIHKLTNLISLDMSNNKLDNANDKYDYGINDICFSQMKNLTELDLSYNDISDTKALKNLTNLTKLNLYCNELEEKAALSGLLELSNITWLDLGQNNISDVSALRNLTNLTYLGLFDTNVSDYSPIQFAIDSGALHE